MAKNKKRRLLVWVSLAVVLAAGVAFAGWHLKRRATAAAQYQTSVVSRGELTQVVTATGQLNPVINVEVGSQISGMIQKLFADYNSPVKEGQIIAQLDPATYEASARQAEADLANAEAALELAQVKATRARELREKELISQSDYDQALADLHQAEATVKTRQATLQRAKIDLARCTIHAPIDGIVISRNVDVGQTVAASLAAPTLFVIANDLTKMQINANVAEADIGNIEAGLDVEFTVDAFPERMFRGKVVQVRNSPIIVQNVVTYDTVIEVNNADLKLKPGMTANVSLIIAHRDDTLKIPNAALRFRPPDTASKPRADTTAQSRAGGGGGSSSWRGHSRSGGLGRSPARTVYVLGADRKPQPVQIKTGISDGIFTEVVEGLKEGDRIVTGMVVQQGSSSRTPSPFGGGVRRF